MIEVTNLVKRYGDRNVVDNLSFTVDKGQIVGFLGPNGAGKSTTMNIITGYISATSGTVKVNGYDIYDDPEKAKACIGYLPEQPPVYPDMKVREYLNFVADLKKVKASEKDKKLRYVMKSTKIMDVSERLIKHLSKGYKQRVGLAGAMLGDPEILILDEPTAVLTPQETEKLFNVLRKMRDDGKAIVIITHKMHEVESLSDRVAVLRNGQYIGSMLTKDTTVTEMTNMMVGHAVTLNIVRPEPVNPKPRIEVQGLTVRNEEGIVKLKDVSFTANSGEILGIAGISGCGQKELLEAIAGLQVTEAGTISYVEDDGSKEMLIGKDPLKIAEMGVSLSFVPEDRLGMGLVGNMDLTDNMMLRSFRQGHTPFTNRKPSKQLATDVVENLEVVTPGITTPVRRLSGGNVQKVLVGREIASAPTVLLTAYVVRGLDINSSYTIYDLINEQKKKGVAVIFVGEDLDVLMELSDRIMVLCGGEVSGILDARKTDKNEVGMLMTRVGGKEHEGKE